MQTSYSLRPADARLGQIIDLFSPRLVTAHIARGIIRAGFGCFRPPVVGGAGDSQLDPGESYQSPTPAVAASVTAILASGGASSTSIQTVSGTAFNGTYGATEMQPARQVTMVLNNNANWDATTAVIRGYNHNGQLVSENLSIPDTGNTTLTTTTRFRTIVDLTIPVQSGTGGTYTLGVSALDGSITLADFQGVALYEPLHMSSASVSSPGLGIINMSPWGVAGANSGSTATGEYGDNDAFSCLEIGGVAVYSETATVDGDDLYVRVASGAGGSLLGAFRNDSDSASCVQVTGAKFIRKGAVGLGFARFK